MATVLLRYQRSDGTTVPQVVKVAPHSRTTIDVATVPGMEHAEFSTVMESDAQVVLDRTMRWDRGRYGSHSETAATDLGRTWYLAEGATHSGFQLFYLLQNPQNEAVQATVTFLRPAPFTPIVQTYASSRRAASRCGSTRPIRDSPLPTSRHRSTQPCRSWSSARCA